jgi:hypothetical protein
LKVSKLNEEENKFKKIEIEGKRREIFHGK